MSLSTTIWRFLIVDPSFNLINAKAPFPCSLIVLAHPATVMTLSIHFVASSATKEVILIRPPCLNYK